MVLYDEQGEYLLGAGIQLSTRENAPIPNERRAQKAPEVMHAAQSMNLGAHSTAKVRSLSSVYNCMGLVFASRRTWIDPEHLGAILKDDKYTQLDNENEIESGDVVVYRNDDGEVSHVGIVAKVLTGLRLDDDPVRLCVLSQWGATGEYFHLADDVSSLLGRPVEYWTDRT